MTDPVAIDARAATALVAAAATATPPSENLAAWAEAVGDRAEAMLRLVPAVVERSEVLAECQPVTGVIVKVEEHPSGPYARGVIHFAATMGTPQGDASLDAHGRGIEHLRTAFLSRRDGLVLTDTARSLVGHHCRFGKRMEAGTDAKGKAINVRMAEWIEDLGPDPLTVNHTSTPTNGQPTNGQRGPIAREARQTEESRPDRPARSPGSVTRPSREDVARAGREAAQRDANRLAGGEGDWYVANGWRDQAQADSTRAALVAALEEAPGLVNVDVMAYARSKGLDWGVAWSADETLLVQAKLRSKLDEVAQGERPALRAVSAGGGDPDYYAPGTEPF